MRHMLLRVLSIGADGRDDEDTRLRKMLLVAAAVLVLLPGILWGLIYWWFEARSAALIPWAYVAFTLVSLGAFARTRNYVVFAAVHLGTMLVLPFLLMWTLGGFVTGSAVAVWAWLSPLGARAVGHRRSGALLFAAFGAGFVISGLIDGLLAPDMALPIGVIAAFFVLNVVGVAAVTLLLMDAAWGGREGVLVTMRSIVNRYFSPDVAVTIVADPGRQELGGELAEVTILFADLGGYTAFSDVSAPDVVLELLNGCFGAAVPAILENGGTPVQLPGDAVMAIFGAPRPIPAHAACAGAAALEIQRRMADLAVAHPEWPRFRIGVSSGEALVGNIGSEEFRNYTAIGDTVNTAQRLSTVAAPGQVIVGRATASRLGGGASIDWLPDVMLKGKAGPVGAGILTALR